MTTEQLATQDTAVWTDHYTEPHTGQLYRQDARGRWYDLAGVRLNVPVFVIDDVLVSLPSKKSKKSYAFRDQEVYVSPHLQLIQIGRLVYDSHLEPVRYYGDRLAGLGRGYLDFGGRDAWQEVRLSAGLNGFLNEFDGRPLLVGGEEVTAHVATHQVSGRRFDVVATEGAHYLFLGSSDEVMEVDNQPVVIVPNTFQQFHARTLVRGLLEGSKVFLDVNQGEVLKLDSLGGEPVTQLQVLDIPGERLYEVETAGSRFVYDDGRKEVYTLDDGYIRPETLKVHYEFGAYLLVATVDGREVITNKANRTVLRFGETGTPITELKGNRNDRLLPAVTARGEQLMLDAGKGVDNLLLALADGKDQIVEVTGEPFRMGGRVFQRASVRRMGGPVPRIITLNASDLALFTLPKTLTAYADQPERSNYAGGEILEVELNNPYKVGQETYHRATFLSYTDDESQVLLDAANGRPLHLDGEGHRNELVTDLVNSTLNVVHWLGEHRLIGAKTLTEDHREGELLYSLETGRSWLPFYDSFLPIFRRVVSPLVAEQNWDYLLLECRQAVGQGEYVAVEKNPPYRILALQDGDRFVPRIISKRDRVVFNPESQTLVQRLLTGAGVLVEVV